MIIIALDIATVTGWAKGEHDGAPCYGSLRFAAPDASENAVFNAALRWAHDFFAEQPRPDVIALEQLLPAGMKGQTNKMTRDRLAGLHAIVRAMAFERGIYRVETVDVRAVRRHFIGNNPKRNTAKREVLRQCRKLGWNPLDDNQGDALAVFHWYASRVNPRLALQVSPLFSRGVAL